MNLTKYDIATELNNKNSSLSVKQYERIISDTFKIIEDMMLQNIKECLDNEKDFSDEKIKINNFGFFSLAYRKWNSYFPSSLVIKFTPARSLRIRLNNFRKDLESKKRDI